MWEWIYVAMVLGPGGYLLGRAQLFDKEPSNNALILTLLWTYVMLFMQFFDQRELSSDHREACQQLEKFLVQRDADAMDLTPEYVEEWDACYRHSEEYLEAEVDYRADQAANR